MNKKKFWRLAQSYLKQDSREEALEIIRGADPEHVMRLARYFAMDYGRLPDELHNMIVLTGGQCAKEYLDRLAGNAGCAGV